MIAYDRLSQIVPADQALAAKALATSLQQISGITNMTLPVLVNAVSRLQTTANLNQISSLTQAVPSSVANYLSNIAGTDGQQIVICDVLGIAAGYQVAEYFANTVATLANTNVTYLTSVYQTMDSVVGNVYGDPVAGPVTIPGGQPAAGVYTATTDGMGNVLVNAAEAAFTGSGGDTPPTGAGLIPVAVIEIANIASNNSSQVSIMNSNFSSMASQVQKEQQLQAAIQIDFANLVANNGPTVYSLIYNLPSYGQQTEPGGMSEFWTGVANIDTFTGQAVVATLREGVNQAALTQAGIQTNAVVPATPNTSN